MNYLAHLFLSANDPADVVGNLAVDFIKGGNPYTHPGILAGMARHRRIDQFTDSHPSFRASRSRVSPPHHRYAGVVVDIFYDHFLARNWATYGGATLDEFSSWAYRLLDAHTAWLPPRLQRALPYMAGEHWMGQYATRAGIGRALNGLSRRSRRDIDLAATLADLDAHYETLHADFAVFFPALIADTATQPGSLAGQLPLAALSQDRLPQP